MLEQIGHLQLHSGYLLVENRILIQADLHFSF